MKKKIFSIYDVKGQSYQIFNITTTKGESVRSFGDEIQNKNSIISKHPEDYSLFLIGEYDDQKGEFTSIKPELLARGEDFKIL
jgi:hypothetical protein